MNVTVTLSMTLDSAPYVSILPPRTITTIIQKQHTAATLFISFHIFINGYYYYFNQDGSLYTGWLEQNGKWYYLNALDNSLQGALFTGWIRRDGKTYFTDSNGEMVEGWYEIDGHWYYFYPGSGEMAHDTQRHPEDTIEPTGDCPSASGRK